MDLNALKEPLGEETFATLETYVSDLIGQRDAARKESIEGRKGLKNELATLKRTQEDLFERLGIASLEELGDLDPKGQAEAAKQFEVKIKRLERELAEKAGAYDGLATKYRGTLQDASLRKALGAHDFIDADLVASYASQRIEWEEDEPRYRTDTGALVPLEEGITTLAKSKPHLLKASGAGGSGFRGSQPGDGKPNPWAKDTRNLTEQARLLREDPTLAAHLRQAAQ